MRRMRSLALSLLLLAAPALAAAPPPPAEARGLKAQGDAKRKGGDPAGALEAYRAALQLHPAYPEAHAAVGEVHYAAKAYPEAIDAFGAAVGLDPEYATAWYNLAFASRKAGDLARARAAYDRYVNLRPADPDGRFGLAETLRAAGERDAAVKEYEAFVAMAQATRAHAAWVERARAAIVELKAGPATATASASASPSPAAAPSPSAAPTASAAPAAPAAPTAPARPAVIPTQALLDKLGQGDRAFLASDHRGALFAYQDAAYLEPGYAPAHVKLGRAYLALRYPALALAQAEQALAIDPTSADALRLAEDAKNPVARAAPPAPARTAEPPAAAPAARTQARVYRLPAVEEPPAAAPKVVIVREPTARPAPAAVEPEPIPAGPTAAERYRTALDHIGRREYAKAIAELNDAIAQDPRLAVAYAARASARFGTGGYREAADDYVAARGLDPELATPVYGLAECYRLLGDPRAAELYRRYADSDARDVRDDLRSVAARRAIELSSR
jgi:tetratricopeptide (TPR) repeat protein